MDGMHRLAAARVDPDELRGLRLRRGDPRSDEPSMATVTSAHWATPRRARRSNFRRARDTGGWLFPWRLHLGMQLVKTERSGKTSARRRESEENLFFLKVDCPASAMRPRIAPMPAKFNAQPTTSTPARPRAHD